MRYFQQILEFQPRAMRGLSKMAFVLALALTLGGSRLEPALAQDELDFLLDDQQGRPPSEEKRPSEKEADEPEAAREEPSKGRERREEPAAPVVETPPKPEPKLERPAAAAAEAERRPPARRVIEEIIVTAQKTEQSLQDVPISMSVLDDEFLNQEGLVDFQDIARYVPNAAIDTSATFPDVRIRGFGSPLSNKAFEQPVALVLDGVPYGRSQYWQGPIFDLDRVEVLRGPQGTLFGKNTTAGLFNVVTKKPTDEYTGHVDVELGEFDRRRFEGAIGGPLIAGLLNFRVSGISDEQDGLVKNTTAAVRPEANELMNGRDRKGVRVQLGLPNLFGANLVVGYERVDFDLIGAGWEFRRVNPNELRFFREYDPNVDVDPENWIGSIDHPEVADRGLETVVANASYDVGSWGLDAIAGYSKLDVVGAQDVDFTPAPIFFTDSVDKNPQTTFELRATSPSLAGFFGLERLLGLALGNTDFIAGFFYQQRKISDSRLAIGLNVPVLAQFVASQSAPAGEVPPLSDFIGTDVSLGDLGVVNDAAPEESTGFFDQTTNSYAGFGQMNWNLLDRWTLEYGMRFTQESKDAHIARVFTKGTGVAFRAVAGQEEFEADRSRSEFAFTPKVTLKYDWTDDVNFFASWAKGFKAGGFLELASNGRSRLDFKPEKATAWELGSKTKLLGGAATLNAGLFWMNVTDLQVFTLRPEDLVATVENAGEARARGAEVDGAWLPTSWLTVVGTLAFNDSEFLEFPFGDCPMDMEDTDGDGDTRCDLTGQPLYRTPKWSSTLTGNVTFPLASIPGISIFPLFSLAGIDLTGGLTGQYEDVQFIERTNDPRSRQPSFFRFNGNLGFENAAQGWSLRLAVQNLTDNAIGIQSRGVSLSQGTFSHILEPPRLLFGSFRWRF